MVLGPAPASGSSRALLEKAKVPADMLVLDNGSLTVTLVDPRNDQVTSTIAQAQPSLGYLSPQWTACVTDRLSLSHGGTGDNQHLLGARYCTGGYIFQVSDPVHGDLLSTPARPFNAFDGQGLQPNVNSSSCATGQ